MIPTAKIKGKKVGKKLSQCFQRYVKNSQNFMVHLNFLFVSRICQKTIRKNDCLLNSIEKCIIEMVIAKKRNILRSVSASVQIFINSWVQSKLKKKICDADFEISFCEISYDSAKKKCIPFLNTNVTNHKYCRSSSLFQKSILLIKILTILKRRYWYWQYWNWYKTDIIEWQDNWYQHSIFISGIANTVYQITGKLVIRLGKLTSIAITFLGILF